MAYQTSLLHAVVASDDRAVVVAAGARTAAPWVN